MAPARFKKSIGILIMLCIPAGVLAREWLPVHPRRMWAVGPLEPGQLTRGFIAMRRDPLLYNMAQFLLSMRTEAPYLEESSLAEEPGFPFGEKNSGEHAPATWYAKSASPWSLEFGAAPAVGAWVPESGEMKDAVFMFGGSLRLGFRYQTELKWHGGGLLNGSCLSGLFKGLWELTGGNQYGADLRLHWLREGDRNRFLLGIQPLSRYVPRLEQDHHLLRFPSLLSILVPEAGLVLGNRTSPGWYVRWMLMPVSLLLSGNVGVELRLAQGLVGDDGTDVKYFWSASLGILVRG